MECSNQKKTIPKGAGPKYEANTDARLEDDLAGLQLNQDATEAPEVALVRPAEFEDDLGRAVVPSRYNLGVVPVQGENADAASKVSTRQGE